MAAPNQHMVLSLEQAVKLEEVAIGVNTTSTISGHIDNLTTRLSLPNVEVQVS